MLSYDLAKVVITVTIASFLVSCASSPSHTLTAPQHEVYSVGERSQGASIGASSGYDCSMENLRTHQVFHAEAVQRNDALKKARSLCLAGQFAQSCSVKFYCSPI